MILVATYQRQLYIGLNVVSMTLRNVLLSSLSLCKISILILNIIAAKVAFIQDFLEMFNIEEMFLH